MNVSRHVYQSSKGGQTFCPLESSARVMCQSTPKFSQQVSSKYGRMASYQVEEDLRDNHGRPISRNRIQQIAKCVGDMIERKEEEWTYTLPEVVQEVEVISLSMDGTTAHMVEEGWREVMCGTISFYNAQADRLYSLYIGQAPEYGKAGFKKRLQREIDRVKARYPTATYVGLADGAGDNWRFLDSQVDHSILDFWHVTEYLGEASKIVSRSRYEQKQWLEQNRHRLRHEKGAGAAILEELKKLRKKKMGTDKRKELEQTITYFTNHVHQMDYAKYAEQKLPIGSGVTEAACKVLVKQRLCNSGMRWKNSGLQKVLNIRSLLLSKGKWKQLWEHVDNIGIAA